MSKFNEVLIERMERRIAELDVQIDTLTIRRNYLKEAVEDYKLLDKAGKHLRGSE